MDLGRTTSVEAIPVIAGALGWPVANAETRARLLQRATPPGWPRPKGKGGGKNAAHITNRHGNNLALAIATATAVTPALMAPDLVAAYRGLRVRDWQGWQRPSEMATCVSAWFRIVGCEDKAASQIIPGDTLGEALDGLVDWTSRPEGLSIRSWFRTSGMWVDLEVGSAFPLCSIGYITTKNETAQSYYHATGSGS